MDEIKTLFIFEILGKPAEYVKSTMEKMINKLGENKGLKIVKKIVHEPKLMEDTKNKFGEVQNKQIIKQELYSTFAEVEIMTEKISMIIDIVLNMLPSHVEILEPFSFNLSNREISELLTDLTIKMHRYDEITKLLLLEKDNLLKKLKKAEEKINDLELKFDGGKTNN